MQDNLSRKTARLHENGCFSITVTINYEDTDAGGVVYYSNYLGYMERARNACLRSLGFPPGALKEERGLLFVVRDVVLEYFSPARLDDEIEVTLRIRKLAGASMVFEHEVTRGGNCLVRGVVGLAVINDRTFKPCRIPGWLRAALETCCAGGRAGD